MSTKRKPGRPSAKSNARSRPAASNSKRARPGKSPGLLAIAILDFLILALLGAALYVTLAVYYPDFSRPYGGIVQSWLHGVLGLGMYSTPLILLLIPALFLKTGLQPTIRKGWAWAWCLTLLASLFGGLFRDSNLPWGGLLGDSSATIGYKYLGALYPVILVFLALVVVGRLAGRSLILLLAKVTARAVVKTGEAVVDVGSAIKEEAIDLAEQRRERKAQREAERVEQEKERELRQQQVIQAEIDAADAPEGDSPLIRQEGSDEVAEPGFPKTIEEQASPENLPPIKLDLSDQLPTDDFSAVVEAAGQADFPIPVDTPAKAPRKPASADSSAQSVDANGQLLMFPSTQTGYELPPLSLLKQAPPRLGEDHHLETRARIIERTLASFKVEAQCINAVIGPRVTRFELKIGAGINVSKIIGLADNLALELAVKAIRIEAPIPGKSAVGVEVPNASPELITLRSVLETPLYQKSNHPLTVGLGRDIAGNPIVANLAKMPHLLVAGATGSGKSVCLNALIVSMLMRNAPDTVRLILIDPKRVEMTNYKDVAHLACPVVHDVGEAQSALKWAVAEMDRRYRLLEAHRARNIAAYNDMVQAPARLPFIVIVVDELADLMMLAGQVIEKLVCRIAQLSRAVGIHLVIATQRPDVKVITGTIKANIPSRIAFAVVSHIDSRTILDANGADKLLGSGDMLFAPIGENVPLRVQGCFLDDAEIDRVVEFCRGQAEANYDDSITRFALDEDEDEGGGGSAEGRDKLFNQALEIVQTSGKASTSYLQRRLRIGYNRAARIMDELEEAGIVSEPDHVGNRTVL